MSGSLIKDLINLIYPALCPGCLETLRTDEKYICINCLYNLPKTNFHLDDNNPMAQLFWGRVKIVSAASFFYFEKGSRSRKVLHHIKYRGIKELALFLGRIYGNKLAAAGKFIFTDLIIPVPLHSSRERTRGFNQSEWFAMGLAESLGKQLCNDILIRSSQTSTQTNKTRIERWENVENCFIVKNQEKIENKHILLVDDVVTTGSTLESCALALTENTGANISILTLAYA